MGSLGTTKVTLSSAVANGATLTVAYPTGLDRAALSGTTGGAAALNNNDTFPQAASGTGTVAFAFGASNITVTNNSGIAWAAGSELIFSFGKTSRNGSYNVTVGGDRLQAAPGDGSGASIQSMTATAAVADTTNILEVAHASTVIAATMDASQHKGLFIVRNTSASGTAAHKLTLTNGTFNGTNTVATLDAPGEALVVFFDGNGRGQVIENTGSVGLSGP